MDSLYPRGYYKATIRWPKIMETQNIWALVPLPLFLCFITFLSSNFSSIEAYVSAPESRFSSEVNFRLKMLSVYRSLNETALAFHTHMPQFLHAWPFTYLYFQTFDCSSFSKWRSNWATYWTLFRFENTFSPLRSISQHSMFTKARDRRNKCLTFKNNASLLVTAYSVLSAVYRSDRFLKKWDSLDGAEDSFSFKTV